MESQSKYFPRGRAAGQDHRVAGMLLSLGRNEEALPIAQGAAEASPAHPGLGPNYPQTLANLNLSAIRR